MLALPPDQTRFDSRAGDITDISYELLGERLVDIMPALGTHEPMNEKQLTKMFPKTPQHLFRPHHWRHDVVTLGEIEREYVSQVTEGMYATPWKAQCNKLLLNGNHDLIVSIGQVVPHEVIGMANYTKNIFVGVGGAEGINESHYLSALYGMERVMGRCDTPLRRILNEAADRFCKNMPIVYVLTVIDSQPDGSKVMRGLYIGDSHDIFEQAGELSAQVNCFRLEEAPRTMVV
ncbi:MAG: lactate racemase domain-containing protein, partial [Chitinophagaceae bacterium]|nr:lactate racemase domain-containing protein [Chitinophagaceae bacterium]